MTGFLARLQEMIQILLHPLVFLTQEGDLPLLRSFQDMIHPTQHEPSDDEADRDEEGHQHEKVGLGAIGSVVASIEAPVARCLLSAGRKDSTVRTQRKVPCRRYRAIL